MTWHPGSAWGVPQRRVLLRISSPSSFPCVQRHGVSHAVRHHGLAQLHQVVVFVPTAFLHDSRQFHAGRCKHQLLVNLVLRGSARRGFGEHRSSVAVGCGIELVEAVEEVVVTRLAGQLPVAHGECVHHAAVQGGVGEGIFCRNRGLLQSAGRRTQIEGFGSTQVSWWKSPIGLQSFGVDRTRKMIVQVTAFWHIVQENQQLGGILANAVEVTLVTSFRRRRVGACQRRRGEQRGQNNNGMEQFRERPQRAHGLAPNHGTGCRLLTTASYQQARSNVQLSFAPGFSTIPEFRQLRGASLEKTTRILISREQIAQKVTELADRITGDCAGEPVVLIGVLKGAAIFLADLARQIKLDVSFDFIATSSYGGARHHSGEVKLTKDVDRSMEGQNVILVEDILDTGLTLIYLQNLLRAHRPKSLRIAALLDKASRRLVPIEGDYVGFEIPDEFVVGYGLDFAERYRNLPDVCILEPGSEVE